MRNTHTATARPKVPARRAPDTAAVPTEAQARKRLDGFQTATDRMTQAEFDEVRAMAAAAEANGY